jgi:hypothetical protein
MGAPPPLGAEVRRTGLSGIVVLAVLSSASASSAQDRYAVLVTGAPGGETYAKAYAALEASFVSTFEGRLKFDRSHVFVLSGTRDEPATRSTAANVRRVLGTLASQVTRDDVVLILLVGHGTSDGDAAKFNLVGPDLEAAQWAALVDALPARVVFVNSTGASFPFLERLSARNRIVITATDSAAQRFDTVFAEKLAEALSDPATDLDRNGRLSLWEVFAQTSAGVARYYDQRGQLPTERPLLDDNGDRTGQQAGAPGPDGALARTTYLDADPVSSVDDPALAALLDRQRSLEEQAEALKLRKRSMPTEEWDAAFEKLMIELARVSRAIRQRS